MKYLDTVLDGVCDPDTRTDIERRREMLNEDQKYLPPRTYVLAYETSRVYEPQHEFLVNTMYYND